MIKGQITSYEERVAIGQSWKAGKTDRQIAQDLQRPVSTIRKWRRRFQREGRAGLTSRMGRPKGGALSQTCAAIVQEITQMRRNHPGWGPITI
jgi:transposase